MDLSILDRVCHVELNNPQTMVLHRTTQLLSYT